MKYIFTVLILALPFFCNAKVPVMYNSVNRNAMNDWVEFTYNALTPDERIGQLIVAVVAPDGTESAKNQGKRNMLKNTVWEGCFSLRER